MLQYPSACVVWCLAVLFPRSLLIPVLVLLAGLWLWWGEDGFQLQHQPSLAVPPDWRESPGLVTNITSSHHHSDKSSEISFIRDGNKAESCDGLADSVDEAWPDSLNSGTPHNWWGRVWLEIVPNQMIMIYILAPSHGNQQLLWGLWWLLYECQ